jgi:hypothetical protein
MEARAALLGENRDERLRRIGAHGTGTAHGALA